MAIYTKLTIVGVTNLVISWNPRSHNTPLSAWNLHNYGAYNNTVDVQDYSVRLLSHTWLGRRKVGLMVECLMHQLFRTCLVCSYSHGSQNKQMLCGWISAAASNIFYTTKYAICVLHVWYFRCITHVILTPVLHVSHV